MKRPILSSLHAAFSFGGFAGAGLGALAAALSVAPLPQFAVAARAVRDPGADRDRPDARARRGRRRARAGDALEALPSRLVAARDRVPVLPDGRGRLVGLEREARARRPRRFGGARRDRLRGVQHRDGHRPADDRSPVGPLGRGRPAAPLRRARRRRLRRRAGDRHGAGRDRGFAVLGLGLAGVVPTLFRAGADQPGVSTGPALAAVTSFGYLGFLGGPPLIGGVAQLTSLRLAAASSCSPACSCGPRRRGRVPGDSGRVIGDSPAVVGDAAGVVGDVGSRVTVSVNRGAPSSVGRSASS